MWGALVIIVGACLCTVGACTDCRTKFSPHDIAQLASAPPPGGALYLSLLFGVVLLSAIAMLLYEHRFPYRPAAAAEEPSCDSSRQSSSRDESRDGSHRALSQSLLVNAAADPAADPAAPSPFLVGLMAIVYPGSLGLDEAVADLLIRAWSSMLSLCSTDGCGHPILYVSIGAWVLSACASALWWCAARLVTPSGG